MLTENTPVLTGIDTARLQTDMLDLYTTEQHWSISCGLFFFFPLRFVCGSLWNSNLSLASHGFHRLHTLFFLFFKIDENMQFRFPLNIMITQGWIHLTFPWVEGGSEGNNSGLIGQGERQIYKVGCTSMPTQASLQLCPCVTARETVWRCVCVCMNKPELTLENRLKQPSRLMTQYTSGRRGPFPLGCSCGGKDYTNN